MIGMLIVVLIIGVVAWFALGGSGEEGSMNPKENIEQADQAQVKSELRTLKQAIRMYRARQGSNPPDLEAVAEEGYVPESALTGPDGEEYQYNPDTGKVQAP